MMATAQPQGFDFGAIESVLDTLLKSENASEFCRALVHSELSNATVQGCHMYLLDNSSLLSPVAGYGMVYATETPEISAWHETPIAEAVRLKSFVFDGHGDGNQKVIAIPLLRDSVPLGALCLILVDGVAEMPFHEKLVPILGKLGAYCLSNMAFATTKGVGREASGDELTSRQIKILDYMAEGLVNAEIATKLLVSESTVRQETVRIYRALGVPNRTEAAKKGRALGLKKRPPPRLVEELRALSK